MKVFRSVCCSFRISTRGTRSKVVIPILNLRSDIRSGVNSVRRTKNKQSERCFRSKPRRNQTSGFERAQVSTGSRVNDTTRTIRIRTLRS